MTAFPARTQGRRPFFPRRIGHIVALLGLLAAVTAARTTPARADDWQLCMTGKPDEVLASCSAVIEQQARDPVELSRAYVRREEWYRMHSRFDEAWADMEQAEKLDPNSYGALVGHGALLIQKGRYDEALALIERAIESKPRVAYGYLLRGNLRRRQNQLAEAMDDYNQAISLRGDVANHYVNRGALFVQMGDLDHAVADLDRAVAINPALADAFFVRGNIYRKKGDLDRATTELTRAIALNSRFAPSFVARGDIFSAKGDLNRAIADYDHALSVAPDNKYAQEMKRLAVAAKAELGKVNAPSHAPATSAAPRTATGAAAPNPAFTVRLPPMRAPAGSSDSAARQDPDTARAQIRITPIPWSGQRFPGAPNVSDLPGY
jgi:tetratricopeptide (TPR) repeat protein